MRNLESIRLIVLDVDGTMTDGGIYIDNNGIEQKKFNIKDGAGIILAQSIGIEFARNKALLAENIAYIGDDLNDLPAMHFVGVSACPLDAVDEVKTFCDYVLPVNGGEGVVRAFVNLLLKSINRFEEAQTNLFPIRD